MGWIVGCDTGGTFTDFFALSDEGESRVAKVPSTPPHFDVAVVEGVQALGIPPQEVETLFHGTTVTTNAVITKAGAASALITTRGFRDVLEIRRANREELYDILWDPPAPLIPRRHRLEVVERVDYAGDVVTPLDEDSVRDAARKIKARGLTSVAVCLVNGHMNPDHERRVREILLEEIPDLHVSLSTDILPEPPEFERTATTVANAYCAPVLRNYMDALETHLAGAGFKSDLVLVMHNGGGTMTTDYAKGVPVKTLNSGPAAGVIAAAAVAAACGRENVVCFDMGGTSADIAVIRDGQPQLTTTFDLEWGMPIRFPSIDVISIGAGGGSIAWLDPAGYPRSGPQSAGADPGPACYGKGGAEPTNTDAHLVLGRVSNELFLEGRMRLDADLAAEALHRRVAEPLGLSLEDAAEGVLRIANANMVKAIRLVTVERGFDPREFGLVAFGGAGPLHAVDLARELQMPEVIVPTFPGVTSAMGLLFVDPLDDFSRAYVRRQDEIGLAEMAQLYREMEDRVVTSLVRQGVDRGRVTVERSIDLRYIGQLHSVTVPLEEVSERGFQAAIAAFHGEHLRQYRYSHPEWLVETSTLRVLARGQREKPDLRAVRYAESEREPLPEREREVHFEGHGWVTTRVVDRGALGSGERIAGPCVIEELDSTVVLPPGTSAAVDGIGNIVITLGEIGRLTSTSATQRVGQIDPMTFEVLRNAFMSVVDEMGLMLERAGHSLVVSEGRDFSAAICDGDGRMVAEGKEDLPAHVGTLPATVKAVISWLGKEKIHEGDVFIMNDAFLGGTHCQDVRTIMPVFRDGALVAFVQNSAHWSDAGGPVPGSFHAEAASTYGEALYIPPIHLVREGELDDEVMRFILRNVRVPETTQGDVFAQIASCRTGEARVQGLIDKYGVDLIEAEMEELIRYSEALLREEFRRIPDGTHSFDDAIDFDPMGDRVTPVAIRLEITIEGDRATYDLSRSDPQAIGAINSTRSMAQSALVVATKAIFPHVPASEGIYNAIDVVNPPGLVTNAQFPRPISGAFATSYEVITACVFGCYLQMLPERSMACSGNMTNMVVGGFDPRPGYDRDFVMYIWKEGGYGARPGKKDNHTAISLYASGTRNEPVEVQERVYPILTHRYEFITDSPGAGRHRGGMGVTRDFELTHGDATLSVLGSRGVEPVWGWEGGLTALGSGLIYDAGGPDELEIGVMRSGVHAKQGKLIRFWEGGGGGWQDPKTRPAEWVLEDVIDGFVSVEAARELYGVEIRVVDEDAALYEVDAEETARLRAAGKA